MKPCSASGRQRGVGTRLRTEVAGAQNGAEWTQASNEVIVLGLYQMRSSEMRMLTAMKEVCMRFVIATLIQRKARLQHVSMTDARRRVDAID
jgi:hypothetical protein